MTACQQFTLLAGEIGVDVDTVLHRLRRWQIAAIIKGYKRRYREDWQRTRIHIASTAAMMGCKETDPRQILPLPFDRYYDDESPGVITAEEEQRLLDLIARENAILSDDSSAQTDVSATP